MTSRLQHDVKISDVDFTSAWESKGVVAAYNRAIRCGVHHGNTILLHDVNFMSVRRSSRFVAFTIKGTQPRNTHYDIMPNDANFTSVRDSSAS